MFLLEFLYRKITGCKNSLQSLGKLFRLLIPALALILFIQSSAWSFLTTQEEGICSPEAESSQECVEASKKLSDSEPAKSAAQEKVIKALKTPKGPLTQKGLATAGKLPDKTSHIPSQPSQKRVVVYLFWGQGCPHCAEEKIFLDEMKKKYSLTIKDFEVWYSKDNAALLNKMAGSYKLKASGVPATFIGDRAFIGFSENSREELEKSISRCSDSECIDPWLVASGKISIENMKAPQIAGKQTEDLECKEKGKTVFIPWIGKLDASELSLPFITLVIAGLDSFNPCAFFVLFSLLGLLIHARSRRKMLLVGSVFVFFSGFIYFIFMAAWLNLFLFMGQVQMITKVAGLIAVLIAAINIKDFFLFKKGVSLTIPDNAKPKLFDRMRKLLTSTSLTSILVGTTALAIAANSYELLCTAGFPMVFTRILTLNNLTTAAYYAYLVLYNVIYVIPLAIIVLIFTVTLGKKKLTEWQGRMLKLISGIMMLGLGVVLLLDPTLLSNALISFLILSGALAVSFIVILLTKRLTG